MNEIKQAIALAERIEAMAVRPVCVCGVPTGTAAIHSVASQLLAALRKLKPATEEEMRIAIDGIGWQDLYAESHTEVTEYRIEGFLACQRQLGIGE